MRFPNFSLKRTSDLMLDEPEDLTSMGTIFLPSRIKKSRGLSGFRIALRVEVGTMSVCLQTLRDNVFHQHTFVDLQLVSKDRSVEFIFQIWPIRESK